MSDVNELEILETSLYVEDLAEAERFYSGILGFELHSKDDKRHLFFRVGDRMLLIFDAEKTREKTGAAPTHGTTGEGHVAFSIDQNGFDLWRRYLEDHGVEIESIVTWEDGNRSLYFRDPSGNSVELTTPAIWGIGEK